MTNIFRSSTRIKPPLSSKRRKEILQLLGLQATQRYDKYLGLPVLIGESGSLAFKSIKDKSVKSFAQVYITLIFYFFLFFILFFLKKEKILNFFKFFTFLIGN
jgi:hypothetical protein